MHLDRFFAEHPVFDSEEFTAYFLARGSKNPHTKKSLLTHHERQGHVLRLRRGLYASVPTGTTPERSAVDSFLVAAKAAPDAVLAYHTALSFHGKAYSLQNEFQFLTATNARPFRLKDASFRPVRFPRALEVSKKLLFGVATAERLGLEVSVTGLERTLVDVLDRPDLSGGWEEVWRSLESVEFFDVDQVVKYALLLGNGTTIGKVGFYLEQHREALMVEDAHLTRLRKHAPREPRYTDPKRRGKSPMRFLAKWNLVVPEELVERSWEAVK